MKILAVIIAIALVGCAQRRIKSESQWTEWDELQPGAAAATVLRVAGKPLLIEPSRGQEFWFWEEGGCAVRMRDGKMQGKTCMGDGPSWEEVGEGSPLIEVLYYVGLSKNVEPVKGGKLYSYQYRTHRCTIRISDKTKAVFSRKCETDYAAQAADDAMMLQMMQSPPSFAAPTFTPPQPSKTSCTSTRGFGGTVNTECESR